MEWYRLVVFPGLNCSPFIHFEWYHREQIVVPHRHHSRRGIFRRQGNHFSQNSMPFRRAAGERSVRLQRARLPFRASLPPCRLRALKSGGRQHRSDCTLSIPLNCDIIELAMLSEKPLPTASVKRHSLDAIDVENDAELDALTAQVLAAGNKIAESERAEMIRKGIIDEDGNLLKTELPEDIRKDADRDFGG